MTRVSAGGMIVGAAVWHRLGGPNGLRLTQRPEVQGWNGKRRHGEEPGDKTR
jgi:hypothetical protein